MVTKNKENNTVLNRFQVWNKKGEKKFEKLWFPLCIVENKKNEDFFTSAVSYNLFENSFQYLGVLRKIRFISNMLLMQKQDV